MIRFEADGTRGTILGLGLSFANLDRLLAHEPIRVDLRDHGGSGALFISVQEDIAAIDAMFPGARSIGLTSGAIRALRSGEPFTIQLAEELGIETFAEAILFAGPTERDIAASLQEAGLLDGAAPLDWTEYDLHEANAVSGCEHCQVRRRPTVVEWIIGHPKMVVVAVIVFAIAVGLPIEQYKKHRRDVKAQALEDEARIRAEKVKAEVVEPDRARRAIVRTRPSWLREPTLTKLRCPYEVAAPRAGWGYATFADVDTTESLERGLRLIAGGAMDVVPLDAEGVGPVSRRLHQDDDVDRLRYRPSTGEFGLTFVVHEWVDVEFVDTERYRAGRVQGRLFVWHHGERAFVCASEIVRASTPQLTQRRRGERLSLTTTRLETLSAAIRAATDDLYVFEPR